MPKSKKVKKALKQKAQQKSKETASKNKSKSKNDHISTNTTELEKQIAKDCALVTKELERTKNMVANLRQEISESLPNDLSTIDKQISAMSSIQKLNDLADIGNNIFGLSQENLEYDETLDSLDYFESKYKNQSNLFCSSPEDHFTHLEEFRDNFSDVSSLFDDFIEVKNKEPATFFEKVKAKRNYEQPSTTKEELEQLKIPPKQVSTAATNITKILSKDSKNSRKFDGTNNSLFDRCVVENEKEDKSYIKPPGNWSPKKRVNKILKRSSSSEKFSINLANFEKSQILDFKRSFELLDFDQDGIITYSDLKSTKSQIDKQDKDRKCQSLEDLTDQSLKDMVDDAMVPINFSIFLNMLGERLYGTDPEETVIEAFRVFDPNQTGKIDRKNLSDILTMQADRFTEEELEEMWKIVDKGEEEGNYLDYENLVQILCYGEQSE